MALLSVGMWLSSSGVFWRWGRALRISLRRTWGVRLRRAYSQKIWVAMRVGPVQSGALLQLRVLGPSNPDNVVRQREHTNTTRPSAPSSSYAFRGFPNYRFSSTITRSMG